MADDVPTGPLAGPIDFRYIRLISLEKLYALWNALPRTDPQRRMIDDEIRRRTTQLFPVRKDMDWTID